MLLYLILAPEYTVASQAEIMESLSKLIEETHTLSQESGFHPTALTKVTGSQSSYELTYTDPRCANQEQSFLIRCLSKDIVTHLRIEKDVVEFTFPLIPEGDPSQLNFYTIKRQLNELPIEYRFLSEENTTDGLDITGKFSLFEIIYGLSTLFREGRILKVYLGLGGKYIEILLNLKMIILYKAFSENDSQQLDNKSLLAEYVKDKVKHKISLNPKLEQTKEYFQFKLQYHDHKKNYFCKEDQGLRVIPTYPKCVNITVDTGRIFFNLRQGKQLILHIDTTGATEIDFYTCIRDLSGSMVTLITEESNDITLGQQCAKYSVFDLLCEFNEIL